MTRIWRVYFRNDGDGWSSLHTTERSALLYFVEQMVSIILEHDEQADEDELRALSPDDLHELYEEITDQGCWFEEVDLLTLTSEAEAKTVVSA